VAASVKRCGGSPFVRMTTPALEDGASDFSAEARILAVMINQVHAANVSGEPAKHICKF